MTALHRTPLFLRGYRFLPHRLLNQATAQVMRARRPRWAVQAAIRAWVARDRIRLEDFEREPWSTVEEFFLRRLRPGARPIGAGLVSPVDGRVVDSGEIAPGRTLEVKGRPISVERLVNGARRRHALPLEAYTGGRYAVIFLSPQGYHRVHAPESGTLTGCQWLPGRFFPQNDDALTHIDAVYERNERAVLRLRLDAGPECLLVMVGASLVGGIELEGLARPQWVGARPLPLALRRDKGAELGHFRFGSTVVVLLPRGAARRLHVTTGAPVAMGQPLIELA